MSPYNSTCSRWFAGRFGLQLVAAVLLGMTTLRPAVTLAQTPVGNSNPYGVIVLVDVSPMAASVPDRSREPRELLISLLTGSFDPSNYPNWAITAKDDDVVNANLKAGRNKPALLHPGDLMQIAPFASKATTLAPRPVQILRSVAMGAEDNFRAYYPTRFGISAGEYDTFLMLARGLSFRTAINYNLDQYLLVELTDGEDSTPHGRGDYTPPEEELVREWEDGRRFEHRQVARLTYYPAGAGTNDSKLYVALYRIKRIDRNPPTGSTPVVKPTPTPITALGATPTPAPTRPPTPTPSVAATPTPTPRAASVELITPPRNSNLKQLPGFSAGTIILRWRPEGIPPGVFYSWSVRPLKSNSHAARSGTTTQTQVSVNLTESGDYRVQVSVTTATGIVASQGYLHVSGGFGSVFFVLLLLAGLVYGGWHFLSTDARAQPPARVQEVDEDQD